MPSELLKYILDNFAGLRVADYVLLLVLLAFAIAGVVALVRWLFQARYEAQKDLLELRQATVDAVKEQLQLIKAERDQLKEEASGQKQQLVELAKSKASIEQASRTTAEAFVQTLLFANNTQYALLVSSNHLLLHRQLIAIYRHFHIYVTLRVSHWVHGAPTDAEIAARLRAVGERLARTVNLFEYLYEEYMDITRSMNVKEATESVGADEISAEMQRISDLLTDNLDKFIAIASESRRV